jgi:hypothetical protein
VAGETWPWSTMAVNGVREGGLHSAELSRDLEHPSHLSEPFPTEVYLLFNVTKVVRKVGRCA